MYIYDEHLRLYVNTDPLLVSNRVLQAAKEFDPDICLEWNGDGFVYAVSYDLAKALSSRLSIRMLTVQEYMGLVGRHPEVASHYFAEWLHDTYATRANTSTSHYIDTKGSRIPIGRPGWFSISDVGERGLPKRVDELPQPGLWKFWSPDFTDFVSGALRNFVTSSGTCSLDLGIPIFATHPKIMIRECYKTLPSARSSELAVVWKTYQQLTQVKDNEGIRSLLLSLDLSNLSPLYNNDEFELHKEQEMLADLRGKKRLLLDDNDQLKVLGWDQLHGLFSPKDPSQATYVLGHPRPDADSVISAIFEAMRRRVSYPSRAALPWAESVPREVRALLGEHVTQMLLSTKKPGRENDIVLVDCHESSMQLQMGVRGIIDHHIVRKKFPYYVAVSHEVSWSSTLQVYVKILGSGWDLDTRLARVLLEATILEAEPSLLNFMGEIDRLAIARLRKIALSARTYRHLMGLMIDTEDARELFYRDYRQTCYGFSVVKSMVSNSYVALAEENNRKENLPLTVVKEIIYAQDFENVTSESLYLVFNSTYHDKGFRHTVREVVCAAYRRFHGKDVVSVSPDCIKVMHTPHQTPRLLLLPLIEQIVQEHLRFVFAACINKYISMGFYGGSNAVHGIPGDESTVKADLSFYEAKRILSSTKSTTMLTLAEFWMVYSEMDHRGYRFALKSLQDECYVELLDTEILDCRIIRTSEGLQEFPIEEAKPGLIKPGEAVSHVGIPLVLHSPDTYGDRTLWRYWSPDSGTNVATRGHIFVMDQTSIDLKVRPEERTPQLTFRPIYSDIPEIRYMIENNAESWIKLTIFPRLFSVVD
ncbi:hypothetical protein BCR34DRAFT_540285 [Clohesyomyces aquaticus]|uniref:DDH domain-containing protein n=1 Tax=Clohesyomyces aquaticus TaxID=1231657 RepID=A0A1Y1ZHS9_9PLEO|nr:hypothetical protein BCR34DRAFT_540285 [Clohesyomyces aquaticus]